MSCPDKIINGECSCPSNFFVQETDLLVDKLLPYKQCKECPKGTYQGPNGPVYECLACDMTRFTIAGDICIPISESIFFTTNFPINTAKSILFNKAETSDPNKDSSIFISNSDTIDYLYLKSGYKCLKENDFKSCNILANICVLQMYDQNNSACSLYNYIKGLKNPFVNSFE
jgi:hypothetical protein